MSIDMSQFYQAFFEEAEELLAQAEHLLLKLDIESPDPEDLNAIFRAAHSIKGGAATFGMADMTEITHVLENLLDKIRKSEMALTSDHVDVFLEAKDMLTSQLDGHRSGADVDRGIEEGIKLKLRAFSEGQVPSVAPVPAPVVEKRLEVPTKSDENGAKTYRIELPKINEKDTENLKAELALLGEVSHEKLDNGYVAFTLKTEDSEDSIVSICSFIVDANDMIITSGGQPPATASNTDSPAVGGQKEYHLEMPELNEKDMANMLSELGLLGEAKPVKTENGKSILTLKTADTKESIESICSFIVDLAKLKITEGSANIEPAKAIYHEEDGFGLFEPLPVHGEAKPPAESGPEQAAPADAAAPVANVAAARPTKENHPMRRESDKAPASQENTSIRVGVEKVDQLINLVGELVITQAMIEQRVGKMDPIGNEALINSIGQLTRNTRDLQEAVMSIRMMPMDYVFSRFPRMVRDLAAKLGKKVEFVTAGATTELDKGLIERIVDPLTHLVRNSIDHGIETPDKRKAAGKSESGRLSLSASNRGGNIVIEVTDDGAGLNRERILSKAKQSGLPVSDNMPDSEVWQLIFAPGFSTAEVVTDVSGRGVGMDVVKRNVSAMGGKIDIQSAPGYGSTISISLPLTLAILDGMSVSLGASLYVIPLNLIVETLQPRMEDIKTVTHEGLMVHVRGEYLPIIPLYALFRQDTEITHPTEGVLVVLEAEGKKAALFVDRLVGQQQVVIKSLETNFKKIQGVSGATIMGDGSVALILDVPAIIKMGQHNQPEGVYQWA